MCPGHGPTSTRRLMSEIFKALQDFKARPPKRHFVNIDAKQIEVPLDKKLEIMRRGEQYYTLSNVDGKTDIIEKCQIKPEAKTQYSQLIPTPHKGYVFLDGDIHWPTGIVDGGKAWLLEYE